MKRKSSSANPKSLDSIFDFSEKEIRRGYRHREVKEFFRRGPEKSALYAVLCAVTEGVNSRAQLYNHFDCFFSMSLNQLTITSANIDEALQQGVNSDLFTVKDDQVTITDKGRRALRVGRLQILHDSYWMQKFLTERIVLIISVFTLLILAAIEIWIASNIGSNAMFFEGIEKLTDLVKVPIIGLSVRYKRDRAGAIMIIGLMTITGGSLAQGAIVSLLVNEPISVTVEAYLVSGLSILFNFGLVYMKTAVGRMSGNLSLLSDAKDNEAHLKITTGVIIGLTFSIFNFYFADALIALLIAGIILWDAAITLKEMVVAGEELSVDTIRLGASAFFEDKITDWVLAQLTRGAAAPSQLNSSFLQGSASACRYYDFHALFGHRELERRGIIKNLDQARRSGLVEETDGELTITDEGLARYYRARAREFTKVANEFSRSRLRHFLTRQLWFILAFFGIIFLIVYAPTINMFLTSI
ncbi:MAG: cation diffusion facilitator family transporter [Promethearchaeota archaeon]